MRRARRDPPVAAGSFTFRMDLLVRRRPARASSSTSRMTSPSKPRRARKPCRRRRARSGSSPARGFHLSAARRASSRSSVSSPSIVSRMAVRAVSSSTPFCAQLVGQAAAHPAGSGGRGRAPACPRRQRRRSSPARAAGRSPPPPPPARSPSSAGAGRAPRRCGGARRAGAARPRAPARCGRAAPAPASRASSTVSPTRRLAASATSAASPMRNAPSTNTLRRSGSCFCGGSAVIFMRVRCVRCLGSELRGTGYRGQGTASNRPSEVHRPVLRRNAVPLLACPLRSPLSPPDPRLMLARTIQPNPRDALSQAHGPNRPLPTAHAADFRALRDREFPSRGAGAVAERGVHGAAAGARAPRHGGVQPAPLGHPLPARRATSSR